MRIIDPTLIPLRLKQVKAWFDGGTWERIIASVPQVLKSVLAGAMHDLCPINDAIKEAIAQGGTVEGAIVIRGHHLGVIYPNHLIQVLAYIVLVREQYGEQVLTVWCCTAMRRRGRSIQLRRTSHGSKESLSR